MAAISILLASSVASGNGARRILEITSQSKMPNRGRWVIIFMISVALVAAIFSAWYQYQHGYRSRQFWGSLIAVLIASAPEVEALQLGPAAELATSEDSQ